MSCEECDEQYYVIDKLAKLLAEIAVIVNGPEPPLTRWSYHDLPEKVRALKQAQQPAAAVPEGYGVRRVCRDFTFDADAQAHTPRLLIEFEPVPVNGGNDAKGWKDRDALAAMLAAAQGVKS